MFNFLLVITLSISSLQLQYDPPKVYIDTIVNPDISVVEPLQPIEMPKAVAYAEKALKPAVVAPDSSGNTYTPGQCTFYAKSRRPDLPNNLGNANTWFARASNQGISTGTIAIAGAIGQKGNHVVYVESVVGTSVRVSEMNYRYIPWETRTKLAAASDYMYIY